MNYIDDEYKLTKKILAYILVPSPHTGEVLADFVKAIVLDWNIDNKSFDLANDNARSNDVMMENLKTWVGSKDCLILERNLFQIRCSNHILHLVALCGMKVVAAFTESIRECVKYVKASHARIERFANVIAQVMLPERD
ncbi:zinc finger BED domain-containing protein RICESLEEPER 2-like [Papaver somniferum]|uniref:zinc finger BED domain-containing protein RICESLEEPER 2-like n=1 Tax=Papaver somniferum TaxID=3469 RepID=UPI000E6FC429|nr:zinc finger BED domain-containing protein RICESLEEPER 2-like [Papaver somniferum]